MESADSDTIVITEMSCPSVLLSYLQILGVYEQQQHIVYVPLSFMVDPPPFGPKNKKTSSCFSFSTHTEFAEKATRRERVYIRYVLYARRLEAMTTDEERKLLRQTAKGGKRGNSAGCETLFALRPNAKKGDNFDASVCVA